MKKQILIVISAITCLLAACSTANFAYYDDIYSSTGEKSAQTGNVAATTGANMSATPTVEADSIIYETDENGNLLRTLTYYPGSSEPVITTYMEVVDENGTKTTVAVDSVGYDPDDYYDYSYSSRIRRFHTDVYAGWDYYDPYFTNLYWYDYAPASWGISIYLGYNWWWPGYYYRPYYYDPFWYNCGFRYGWGWYGPYYAYRDPWYRPYGPGPYHGPADYYHNHRDHNNSYFYGHRNNLGPSVGNGNGGHGGRPDKDNPNGYIAGGTGNGETNNHYSVNSSPASFNQRYDALAGATGATGAGSANGGHATPSATGRIQGKNPTQQTNTNDGRVTNSVSRENMTVVKEPTAPSNPSSTARPATQAKMDAGTQATSTRPAAGGETVTSTSKPSQTVTRTVVTPSSSRTTTTTRPATTTRTVTRTVTRPTSGTSTPSSSTRPTSTSRPAANSGRPSSTSRPAATSSSRSNYSEPARSNRSNYNESSSSRSSSTTSSRPSSSSNRSSTTTSRPSSSSSSRGSGYSSSSSRGGGFSSGGSRGGGSSHSGGGGHSSGGGGGRR